MTFATAHDVFFFPSFESLKYEFKLSGILSDISSGGEMNEFLDQV